MIENIVEKLVYLHTNKKEVIGRYLSTAITSWFSDWVGVKEGDVSTWDIYELDEWFASDLADHAVWLDAPLAKMTGIKWFFKSQPIAVERDIGGGKKSQIVSNVGMGRILPHAKQSVISQVKRCARDFIFAEQEFSLSPVDASQQKTPIANEIVAQAWTDWWEQLYHQNPEAFVQRSAKFFNTEFFNDTLKNIDEKVLICSTSLFSGTFFLLLSAECTHAILRKQDLKDKKNSEKMHPDLKQPKVDLQALAGLLRDKRVGIVDARSEILHATIGQIMDLKIGDVLITQHALDRPFKLFVDTSGEMLGSAWLGQNYQTRAIKIIEK